MKIKLFGSWCTHGPVATGLALQLGVAQQLLPQRADDLEVNGHMMKKVSGKRFGCTRRTDARARRPSSTAVSGELGTAACARAEESRGRGRRRCWVRGGQEVGEEDGRTELTMAMHTPTHAASPPAMMSAPMIDAGMDLLIK